MQVVYVGKYYSHVIPVTFQEGMKAIQGRSQAAKQSPNYCSLTRPVAYRILLLCARSESPLATSGIISSG